MIISGISLEDAAHICASTAMNISEKMITGFCHFVTASLCKILMQIPYFEMEYMNMNKRFRVFLYDRFQRLSLYVSVNQGNFDPT